MVATFVRTTNGELDRKNAALEVAQKCGIGDVRDLNRSRVHHYSACFRHLYKTGQMLVCSHILWEHAMAEWLMLPRRRFGN
jgi:hypothetical protein